MYNKRSLDTILHILARKTHHMVHGCWHTIQCMNKHIGSMHNWRAHHRKTSINIYVICGTLWNAICVVIKKCKRSGSNHFLSTYPCILWSSVYYPKWKFHTTTAIFHDRISPPPASSVCVPLQKRWFTVPCVLWQCMINPPKLLQANQSQSHISIVHYKPLFHMNLYLLIWRWVTHETLVWWVADK